MCHFSLLRKLKFIFEICHMDLYVRCTYYYYSMLKGKSSVTVLLILVMMLIYIIKLLIEAFV